MADEYEQNHVHEVYQQIAGHFSATRFKVSETKHLRNGAPRQPQPTPQLISLGLNMMTGLAHRGTISSGAVSRVCWSGRRMWQWEEFDRQ